MVGWDFNNIYLGGYTDTDYAGFDSTISSNTRKFMVASYNPTTTSYNWIKTIQDTSTNLLASANGAALSDDEQTVAFVNQLASDKAVTLVVLEAASGSVLYPIKHVVVDYSVNIEIQPNSVAFAGNDVVWVAVTKEFTGGSYDDFKSYLVSFLLETSGISVTNNLSAPDSSTHSLLTSVRTVSGTLNMIVGGAYAIAAG